MLPKSRAEERKVPEERGSERIQDSQYPVRLMRTPDVHTMLHEQERADRQVRLVARNNRAAVNAAKRLSSGLREH